MPNHIFGPKKQKKQFSNFSSSMETENLIWSPIVVYFCTKMTLSDIGEELWFLHGITLSKIKRNTNVKVWPKIYSDSLVE